MSADPTLGPVLLIGAIALSFVIPALLGWRRRRKDIALEQRLTRLALRLAALDHQVSILFDGKRSVRLPDADGLRGQITTAVEQAEAQKQWLPERERRLLDRLAPLTSRDAFQRRCEQANRKHETTETRREQAAQLAPRILALDQEVSAFFDGRKNVRHWAANGLRERVAAAVEQASSVHELLPVRERRLLDELTPLASLDGFKRRCEQANRQYEAAEWRKRQFAQTALRLEALDRKISDLFDCKRYVRHSSANTLRQHTATAVQQGKTVRKWLSETERRLLNRLVQIASPKNFERHRERVNRQYVDAAQPSVFESCRVAGLTPTDEQAEAIATDEDVTLVLAGAGTGKTTTIIGKVAHLVSDQGVRPGEILILAYNSDAAEQIRERLPASMAG